jgi:hypothetical protein
VYFSDDPVIDPTLRDCVVFLLQDRILESTGEPIRKACGTGFIVCVRATSNGFWMPYIVTARHCYENSDKTKPLFARMNTKDGGFEDVELEYNRWEQHPTTDVAVIPISVSHTAWVSFIAAELLMSEDDLKMSSLREGQDVGYISLFSQHHGSKRNLPLTRKGSIALMPREKVSVTLGGNNRTDVEAFLIETRSWGGQSGAPVFVDYPECIRHVDLKASPLRLLGLISGHFELNRELQVNGEFTGMVAENSGISIVIPAQAILDLLLDEHLAANREHDAVQLERQLRESGFLIERRDPP